MYRDTIDYFADQAARKADDIRSNLPGFFVASAMAGAYVGIGIILIFTLGQAVDPNLRTLVMGTSFGIALTLVVFAGAELFTGHTMYMTLGLLQAKTGLADLGKSWALTWLGNLAGSALLAYLFWLGGGGLILKEGADLVFKVASSKMNDSALALFSRGILCNWLVCLALWMSARAKGDGAKCILIFWCLFAFIASGFEHSVANMTLFSIALLGDHPASVSFAGMAHNLVWVTAGNIVSGAVFMALGYWLANGKAGIKTAAPRARTSEEV